MKYYIVKADTRDGEHEYMNVATMRSPVELDHDEAEKFAQNWFGFGEECYQITTLRSYAEITKDEYDVFKKYGV